MPYEPITKRVTLDLWTNYTPITERWLPISKGADPNEVIPAPWISGLTSNRYSFLDNYIDIYMVMDAGSTNNIDPTELITVTYIRMNGTRNAPDPNKSYDVYYFVNNYEFIPNGIRFYVTRDNYMTEIGRADIMVKNIRRCNKYCGVSATAKRLNVPNSYHWDNTMEIAKINFPTADIRVFAQIQYTGSSSAGAAIYNVHTFIFKFSTRTAVYNAVTQIRNIYAALIGTQAKEQQASVLNIWIGVTDWYGYTDGDTTPFITQSFKTYDYQLNSLTLTGEELPNGYTEYPVILSPVGLGVNARLIPLTNPNCVQITTPTGYLGIGAKWDKLEMPNIATQETVYFRIWYGDDGIKIVVEYKGLARDITDNFAITNVTNDNQTSQKRMATALSTMAKVAGSAAQIATGNPVGIVSGVAGIAGAITDQIPQNNGQYVSGGNGLILWNLINRNNSTTPFFFVSIAVEASESGPKTKGYQLTQEDIYYNGAEMEGANGSLQTIIDTYLTADRNYLCQGVQDISKLKRYEAFIAADVEVSGVSLAAKAEIEAAFAQGIKVKMWNE